MPLPLRRTSGTSRGATARVGRARDRPPRAAALLAHTFVIGMQTMRGGPRAACRDDGGDLGVRVAAGLAYLYIELTPTSGRWASSSLSLLVALAADSGAGSDGRRARRPCCRARCSPCTSSSMLFAYASFALACVHRRHLRAAVQGDQGEASGLLLARLPSLQVLDGMNVRAVDDRLDLPDDRRGRSAACGRPGARRLAPTRGCRPCRSRIRRSSSRCCRWARVLVRAVRAPRRMGWSGRRAAWLSAVGFAIVLLNFVPVGYFLTKSHNF